MSITPTEYDILLLSPWTERVHVNPGYQMIRNELTRYFQQVNAEVLKAYLPSESSDDSRYGDVNRYQQQYPYTPGMLAIASVLERENWRVGCISLDLMREKFAEHGDAWLEKAVEHLAARVTTAVGITAVTPEYPRAIRALEAFKRVAPHLKTLIGGTHVSYEDQAPGEDPCVDAVVRFEGEFTVVELMDRWSKGELIDDVAGITLMKNGKVTRNRPRKLCDLSKLPMPAYHLFDAEMRERVHVTPTFTRGCPYNCSYCVEADFWSRKLRHKDVKTFVDELEYIAEEFDWRFIHIADSTFGINREETHKLCDELERRKLRAVFSVNIRPNATKYIGEDLIRRLREVNFVEFYIGMESTSEELLSKLNRSQEQLELEKTLRFLKDLETPFVKLYLVVGLPGETHATIQHTINRVSAYVEQGLAFYATAKYFTPVPGTTEASNSNERNLLLTDDWSKFERYNFPPVVEHDNMGPFELESYLMLLQSRQLGIYRKRMGRFDDEYERINRWAVEKYHKAIYL